MRPGVYLFSIKPGSAEVDRETLLGDVDACSRPPGSSAMTTSCVHDHEASPTPSLPVAVRLPHRAIRAYQWVFAGRVSPCRYEPSCSNYALGSLEARGLLQRLMAGGPSTESLPPWGGHGWDPVPPRKAA